MDKTLNGIYVVEKKYSLIWLNNSEKKTTETMKYFDFAAILHQSFNEKQIKVILEALNCDEKLLIDFDKEKVKLINKKEDPFVKEMNNFMNIKAVQNLVEDQPEFNWLNFGFEFKKD